MFNDIDICKSEISQYFTRFGHNIKQTLSCRTDAKVYEVFCLQRLLKWIDNRYDVEIEFVPRSGVLQNQNAIILRASAGYVKRGKHSYFTISPSNSGENEVAPLEVHLNIEVLIRTAENLRSGNTPLRQRSYEIDVVVIESSVPDNTRPWYTNLALGLECKLVKNFTKQIVAKVTGIRGATSTDVNRNRSFILDDILKIKPGKKPRLVRTDPKSEYWLVQTHDNAREYRDSLRSQNVKLYLWRRKV